MTVARAGMLLRLPLRPEEPRRPHRTHRHEAGGQLQEVRGPQRRGRRARAHQEGAADQQQQQQQ